MADQQKTSPAVPQHKRMAMGRPVPQPRHTPKTPA
jgi:hypothetical protein